MKLTREQKWNAISIGAVVIAALAVRRAMKAAWKAKRGDDPPLNPLREDSTWTDAVLFSVATGLAVGLARLGARAATAATLDPERRPNLPSWLR